MNREEKRQLVIKLYQEGKTMREISKVVHMSFGDIGSIIRKENEDAAPKSKEKSQESQALKLFNKEKDPIDVAITLDIPASKAEGIYKQFLKLRGLSDMVNLYEEIKGDVALLASLYDTVKACHLTKDDINNIVSYAPEHVYLKDDIKELKEHLRSLLTQKSRANTSLVSIKKEHTEFEERIDELSVTCMRKMSYIENLDSKTKQLETYISKLKTSNEYYTKFEKFANEKLKSITKDSKWILALAIDAVIESIRRDPFKEVMVYGVITHEHKNKLLELCDSLFDKLSSKFMEMTLENDSTQEITSAGTNFLVSER
jgi:SMC interacting uncharacterized protein involved in chromosome segregation